MVPRRSLVVGVAAALAVIASVAAYSVLHSAQARAYHNATLKSVYVLKAVVPRDDSVASAYTQGLITRSQMPRQFVPAGAVTDLAALDNRVAAADLPAGEVVVASMFAPAKSLPSLAAQTMPPGDVAVTVSVDQTHGVAGLIEPGDDVDIMVDLAGTQESYLYQSVPVLAVGSTVVSSPAPAAGTSSGGTSSGPAPATSTEITFAVSPAAAAHIALAQSGGGGVAGGIYLALVPRGNPTVASTTGSGAMSGWDLVPAGQAATAATISGPSSGASAASSPGASQGAATPTGGGHNELTP